ncbi:hypothetical protein ACQKOE_14035 [Novosphingobium sp. NPDC080210]|uniref:hypothetical protein n=1 Tax=Novosphingobium sp. NPDC080210 TaxID=3390596 RepID=UPI003D05E25A
MLKRQTAAQYCDMSVGAFEREIVAGRLPSPVMLGGREHWCKNALDKALDRIAGNIATDGPEPTYRQQLRQRYEKAA